MVPRYCKKIKTHRNQSRLYRLITNREIFFIMNHYKTVGILVSFIFSLIFISCSSSDAERRIDAAQLVESRSSQDLLKDLYLASDGKTESLARVLQVTPSSINRIYKGETEPTVKFDERIKTVALYYYQADRKFSKIQSALDNEYGWYDSVLNFPSHHPWIFWIINIVILLILAFAALVVIWPILAEMLIFLIAWIACLICSPDAMTDNYTTTINPVIEQVI